MRSRSALFLLCSALLLPLLGSTASAQNARGEQQPFSPALLKRLAANLAKQPFVPPPAPSSERWANLGYDQYRDIRFRRARALWHGEHKNFELQLLPAAWLYKDPVSINVVTDGFARAITPNNAWFTFGSVVGPPGDAPPIGFSGFRITGPINRPRVFDEIIVFQGASYFRAVSKGQNYGLSARGLAIDTAQPSGEEFPFFRSFWIETPTAQQSYVTVHALLDSPSATGAYRFRIRGGAPTTVDVDVTLYPRRDLLHAGIAPLTSMFLFSGIDRARIEDFRPAVHDSDGLAIANAAGERVWRPLTNPRRLQVSAFTVRNLTGFGLLQRARKFADFQDLEARYDRRPSAWVTPRGSWGEGSVLLVEIPSEEEIHDNVVAFWQPLRPYGGGQNYAFAYRLTWPADVPATPLASVRDTLSGPTNGPERKTGAIRYIVDFAGSALLDPELPDAALQTTAGSVTTPVVERNPYRGGVRVDFLLNPGQAELAELRLELKRHAKTISEVWLARWTK